MKPRSRARRKNVVRLFVSYSHKDAYWKEALMPVLHFAGVEVDAWSDKEIRPGKRWDDEIKEALEKMDVFIPLMSVNFAVSQYISTVEYPIAQDKHARGEIEVVPVLVAEPADCDCDWLKTLQRVPPGAKSWAEIRQEFQHHDMALKPIREGIHEVVLRAQQKLRGRKP